MPNRQLTKPELKTLARPLLAEVRKRLHELSDNDPNLLWALRRKLFKELMHDERGKPMHRVALIDRLQAMDGYTLNNTRVLCPQCDTKVQVEQGYA